jgi:hypothetical protein
VAKRTVVDRDLPFPVVENETSIFGTVFNKMGPEADVRFGRACTHGGSLMTDLSSKKFKALQEAEECVSIPLTSKQAASYSAVDADLKAQAGCELIGSRRSL